jgi:hypothetical protein
MDKVVIPVDPEHGLFRLVIVFVFFGITIAAYLVVSVIAPQEGLFNILGLIVGLASGVLVAQVVDQVLKKRWPSGRKLEIDGDKIRFTLKDKVQREIDGSQMVNVLTWHFEIKKRARVPKGWYVVAIALLQDDLYMPVYTFMSPDDFRSAPLHKEYDKLQPKSDSKDMRLAGQQKRLHTAETARYIDGAEMSKADYDAYITHLQTRFPSWMIGS